MYLSITKWSCICQYNSFSLSLTYACISDNSYGPLAREHSPADMTENIIKHLIPYENNLYRKQKHNRHTIDTWKQELYVRCKGLCVYVCVEWTCSPDMSMFIISHRLYSYVYVWGGECLLYPHMIPTTADRPYVGRVWTKRTYINVGTRSVRGSMKYHSSREQVAHTRIV